MISVISENNKRIAKNTALLYIRMLLIMSVTLYTSRVVLQVLGVEDFGIYNVVGGIVAMFSFINASMSGATARFLMYEMGENNKNKLRIIFNSALLIHISIALLIILIAETVGLWFLNTRLVIPADRMNAAIWVYQFSILSTVVSVTQVPYNACIIAHEKMDVYAYVEILNVILKLLIVFLLVAGDFDKLIFYALLIFLVSTVIACIYRLYCVRHFDESKLLHQWHFENIKPMLSFSGWDLYGNMSTVARTQGINMLLNMFFGPLLNAASGIAGQVQGAVMSFAGNVVIAVKPQIIKSYAAGEYSRMVSLVMNASKLTFLLLLLLSLPLIVEMHFVLSLWLKTVPEYTVQFCVCTLLFNFFATMSVVVVTAAHATGKVKRPSLINGTLYLSVIPVSYVAFKFGLSPVTSYIFNIIAVIIGLLSNVWTIHKYIPVFSFKNYIYTVFTRCMAVFLASSGLVWWLKGIIHEEGFFRFIIISIVSTMVVVLLGFYVVLNKSMRIMIVQYIKNKICKKV